MSTQSKYIASLSWEALQAKLARLETEIAEIKATPYRDPREFLSKLQFRDAVAREISKRHQNLMTAIFEDEASEDERFRD